MLLTGCQQCNIETTEVCNKFGCICKDGFFGTTCDESKFVNEIMLISHTFQNKYCFQNANAMTKAPSLAIEKPENVFAKAYMASMARPVMKVSFLNLTVILF